MKQALLAAREALKSAQEYIEAELKDRIDLYGSYPNLAYKYATEQRDLDENIAALAIIDAALAQPEQEPVAELIRGEGGAFRVTPNMDALKAIYALPIGTHRLYAAPVAQAEWTLPKPLAFYDPTTKTTAKTGNELPRGATVWPVYGERQMREAFEAGRATPVAQKEQAE